MTHWNWGNIIVNVSIGVNASAFLGYALQGDWKRALYWFSATLITVSVRIM